MLEFLKLILKIRQLSLNSLRNIFDFESQNRGGGGMTKTQMIPILAHLKKLSDKIYKTDFSKSLLTYQSELLWPNCRSIFTTTCGIVTKPFMGSVNI